MFKNASFRLINTKAYNSLYLKTLNIFYYTRKNSKIKGAVEEVQNSETLKINFGTYPYFPLNDHPLIPGYGRLVTVTSEITNRLKEINAEKTKIVISISKTGENTEALQSPL